MATEVGTSPNETAARTEHPTLYAAVDEIMDASVPLATALRIYREERVRRDRIPVRDREFGDQWEGRLMASKWAVVQLTGITPREIGMCRTREVGASEKSEDATDA